MIEAADTAVAGVFTIAPEVHTDARGFSSKSMVKAPFSGTQLCP
jgi:dTDP-4-dehydrorhamnose 3,5-epimerase-like enzyme